MGAAPRFPPPPVAPIRRKDVPPVPPLPLTVNTTNLTGQPPRRSLSSRQSTVSMASTASNATLSMFGSPQPARGLRPPPPPRRSLRVGVNSSLLTIPASPDDDRAISPILSGALPGKATAAGNELAYPPTVYSLPYTVKTEPRSPNSPADDVIPDEHKRVPGLIPRSPLSPVERVGQFIARRGVRRAVPVPVVVVERAGPERAVGVWCEVGGEKEMVVVSSGRAVVVEEGEDVERGLGIRKPKRKTVWGINVEGWWELGLLERMGTLRGKR